MKQYSTFPKAPAQLEPHLQIFLISYSLWRSLTPLQRSSRCTAPTNRAKSRFSNKTYSISGFGIIGGMTSGVTSGWHLDWHLLFELSLEIYQDIHLSELTYFVSTEVIYTISDFILDWLSLVVTSSQTKKVLVNFVLLRLSIGLSCLDNRTIRKLIKIDIWNDTWTGFLSGLNFMSINPDGILSDESQFIKAFIRIDLYLHLYGISCWLTFGLDFHQLVNFHWTIWNDIWTDIHLVYINWVSFGLVDQTLTSILCSIQKPSFENQK